MASLTAQGVALVIPDDLEWVDEFEWSPVEQHQEYLSEGALVIQEGARQAGRPITLIGGEFVLVDHAVVTALMAEIAVSAGKTYTLTLADGRTLNVAFDHSRGAIVAPVHKLFRQHVYGPHTQHLLTLRFIEVAP